MLLDLGRFFRRFADVEAPNSPLYQSICRAVADAPDVAGMLNVAPEMERRPNLLLAAVHDILLEQRQGKIRSPAERALRPFYPTISAQPIPPGEEAGAAFVKFCRTARRELEALIATRTTQTNEVGRSSLLWPVLSALSHDVDGVRLVEVGASAGLNLLLDRWAYCDAEDRPLPGGDPMSPVRLRTRHLGARPGDSTLKIASRVGLDRSPIDVTDSDAARWLLACMWPDELDRFRRTEAAVALAAQTPPRLIRGDAVADLGLITAGATDGHLTIVTTWMLTYLEPAARSAFVAALDGLGAQSDLTWVIAESPMYSPELPWPEGSTERSPKGETLLVEVRYRDGARTVRTHARAHPHGRWIDWIAT